MPKEKMYTLTVNEAQLANIQDALEWFFRLQMGQFFDYATTVAKCGYEYDKDDPDNERKFYEYIQRRDDAKELLDKAFRIAQPTNCRQTEDMMIAQDIWADIRHFRWKERPEPKSHDTRDAWDPLHISGLTPVKIERAESKYRGKANG